MKYLYGIQPTGRIHLGNYLGGLKLALEKKSRVLVAQYHAETTGSNTVINVVNVLETLEELGGKAYMQNPDAAVLAFKIQCVTPMSDLRRMTQFKDKGEGNVGLFTYPCLMAADIILSDCDAVIVGEDQIQHMEFYRRTCKRLGIKKVAKTILTETPRIMSIKDPTRKMSKSLGDAHCLYIGDHDENRRKIMKAPTTPEGIANLRQIADGLGVSYSDSGNMKEFKEAIIKALMLI